MRLKLAQFLIRDHDRELRAKIEPIPDRDDDPDKAFLWRSFMRRVGERTLPEGRDYRPVPPSWVGETLDPAWDTTAGRRRPEKQED